MNDEYASFPTKIFIDSNVVLEALPLKDLPWSEIDPVGPILIMLTPTLLSEVDSKKRDGRLGVRAREFNRFVAPIANDGQPINLVEGTPRVDIVIVKCRRIDWAVYDDLDPSQGDARIIAEVLNVRGVPKEQRIVVGQDINPLFMAQRHGLKTHHVSDSWLPRPEPSPQEKEIAKLKRQIVEYAKAEPHFDVKLETQSGPVEIHQVQELTEQEVSSLVNYIIATNPKPVQNKTSLAFLLHDSSLDKRYSKYAGKDVPNFARDYHKKLELIFGQIPFTLSVENTGKVRADHASINVQIVGGWFNTKPIIAGIYPSAPRGKSPFEHSPLYLPTLSQRAVGRHEVEVDEPRRTEQFSAQCEDFRHGQKWVFSGVVWLDPHQEREIVIIVKITAANLHGEISTPFKLDKKVITSQAFDLVDRNNGRTLKSYHVKPLVDEAIRNEEYNAIEFDHFTDDD